VKRASMLRGLTRATQEVIPLITSFVMLSIYYKFGGDGMTTTPLTPTIVFSTVRACVRVYVACVACVRALVCTRAGCMLTVCLHACLLTCPGWLSTA
jgi:hypothetical protein